MCEKLVGWKSLLKGSLRANPSKVSAPNSGQFLLSVLYLRHASKLLDS